MVPRQSSLLTVSGLLRKGVVRKGCLAYTPSVRAVSSQLTFCLTQ